VLITMDLEQQLPSLMQHAVDTLEPDPAPLVAGGLARGRRKRRQHQLTRAAEGLTVLAVVGGIAAIVVSTLPGRSPSTRAPAGAAPVAPLGAVSAPASVASSRATPTATLTPQQLQAIVVRLLPRPGTISHRTGNSEDGFVATEFVYDDGHGPAMVDVALSYPPLGDGLGAGCQISVCTTNPDGSRTAVYQGNGHPGHPSIPGKDWEVSLQRTDGVVVDVTEWNSPQEKDGAITRAEPPFTIAELKTIVASPSFTVHPN
jgi:hypothetical protein